MSIEELPKDSEYRAVGNALANETAYQPIDGQAADYASIGGKGSTYIARPGGGNDEYSMAPGTAASLVAPSTVDYVSISQIGTGTMSAEASYRPMNAKEEQ